MTRFDLLLVLLFLIVILLFSIDSKLGKIDRRMRERFPTEKEQDRDWAKKDPMGHAEAHMKEKVSSAGNHAMDLMTTVFLPVA